jgi:predicted esterase
MVSDTTLGFTHLFSPPRDGSDRVLLLLHGTGGDEHALVPLAQALAPDLGVLSPRGQVLERGMPRFFRRLAEGVFDQDDLRRRTEALGDFLVAAGQCYAFDPARVVAVGFSNGANIATSLLLRRPGLLRSAVLLHPLLPYEPEQPPKLHGTRALIGAGRHDPLVPVSHTERLAHLLRAGGADVRVAWHDGGHDIALAEIHDAGRFIATLDEPDVAPTATT